ATNPHPGPHPSGGPRQPLPCPIAEGFEEQPLGLPTAGTPESQPRRDHARLVHDDELAVELLGELREPPVPHLAGGAIEHHEPRLVAPLGRVLGDQLGRQLVLEPGGFHPGATVSSRPWITAPSSGPGARSKAPRS